ncbi:hypothetical protein PTSG_01982 [Salpingoeca rosetta]|uniref:TFIIS N-terminal domain-containing protein n=1 Tax=Salpingoeca rosetta (strain ATCC 50818 / BSB-021) TaxID=946362 RepID=F2TZI9_SALR5|nr:uncharacterized protein PTSG_01982 [Salpingoeca rosetta]EGD79013.1 hypothetical protein PTSG_01982 [Salpingoeca rosetta]|eukprot:XP_004997969.1 hypothetical protein PTSG_01982 [Salpingoeca rosetta]
MAAPRTPTMTSLMTWFKDNKDISATTDTENAARSKELLELLNKCREVAERSLALKMLAHLSKGPGQPIVSKCLHAGAWQTLFDWLTRARQTNQTAVLTALMETLQVLPVTLDLLTQNELARTVKQCRKIPEVSAKAKALVTKWKTIVTQTGAKSAAKPSPTTSTAQQPQSARPSTGVAAGAAAATAAKTAVKTATAKRRPSHDAEPQAKVARVKTEGTAQHLSEAQMRASGKFILKEEPGPSRAKTASGTDATVPVASRSFGKAQALDRPASTKSANTPHQCSNRQVAPSRNSGINHAFLGSDTDCSTAQTHWASTSDAESHGSPRSPAWATTTR